MTQQQTRPTSLWWKHGVVYQIYPRSFKDSTGNGVGDLQGIIDKLDYLEELGVDAIWISPCFPSPMADFGYDVSDYVDIHPLFGTLEIMDALIRAAHKRNLKIMLDLVPNHSSDRHAWFKESRSSRDNPKRDWYVWRDAKPDGSPPNNWLSVFGGSSWEWEEATEQFYLHSFLTEQPDLNWRNPEVKNAMFEVVRFWLDKGVDGFRIDVAHFIMKDPEMRDNPRNEGTEGQFPKNNPGYEDFVHVHDIGHADNHVVFRELREILDSYDAISPRTSVGEIHIFNWDEWVKYYGENNDGLHMPLNFQLLFANWDAISVRTIVDGLEAALPQGAWPNYVLGNHDEKRLATRYGPESVRLAGMLLLTLRGTPTMYYGDEIGMSDVFVAEENFQDPWPIRAGNPDLTRDPNRTPMQWAPDPGGGFSPPKSAAPWLPLHEDHVTVNVQTQRADPGSTFNFYKQLLQIRKSHVALSHGTYRAVEGMPHATFVYIREYGSERMLVALNFSDEPCALDLSTYGAGEVALSTELDREGEVDLSNVNLREHEGLLVKLT